MREITVRIGELSRETGVSQRLLRYYEEQGLLTPDRTEPGGHRRYGETASVTVGHIRALLAAGLPTAVIKDVLPCIEGPGADGLGPELHSCVTDTLRRQLTSLDEKITTLHTARSALAGLLAATRQPGA